MRTQQSNGELPPFSNLHFLIKGRPRLQLYPKRGQCGPSCECFQVSMFVITPIKSGYQCTLMKYVCYFSGFRIISTCFHPHLDLPPSRGKKSKEVGLTLCRNDGNLTVPGSGVSLRFSFTLPALSKRSASMGETLWYCLQAAVPIDALRLLRTGCGKLALTAFYRNRSFPQV